MKSIGIYIAAGKQNILCSPYSINKDRVVTRKVREGKKVIFFLAGDSCSGLNQALCEAGTFCENRDRCKINNGGDCGNGNEAFCAVGFDCDTDDLCKIPCNL